MSSGPPSPDPAAKPRRRSRIGSARFGLALAVIFFVAGAVLWARASDWFDLNRWREPAERELSERLGRPVGIGRLDLRWRGLTPEVHIQQLTLASPEAGTAAAPMLSIEQVRISLALRALWGGQWKFRRIELEGLDLRIERLSARRWQVAGQTIDLDQPGQSGALDWLMGQPSLSISRARVQMLDRMGAAPLVFERGALALRNGLRQHQIRVQAHQPEGASKAFDAFELVAEIATRPGVRRDDWKQWKSELYAKLDAADAALVHDQLLQWTALDSPLTRGRMDVQAWVTLDKGQPHDARLKFAATDPAFNWPAHQSPRGPQALVLRSASGYVAATLPTEGGAHLKIYSAQIVDRRGTQVAVTQDVHELRLNRHGDLLAGKFAVQGFNAANLLASLRAMPLPQALLDRIAPWDIRGQVSSLSVQWDTVAGPRPDGEPPVRYSAQAQFDKLGFSLREVEESRRAPGSLRLPAFADVSGRATLDERGGTLELDSRKAQLTFPGLFDEPVVPLDSLSGRVQWALIYAGDAIRGARIQIPGLRFANADAAGQIQGTYQSGGKGAGLVDLKGRLDRATGDRTVRYLPRRIPQPVRDWVARSVIGGSSGDVQFRLRGDLWDFPFREPDSGEFLIQAKVQGADLNYSPSWPGIKNFAGELKFLNGGMDITMDSGTMYGLSLRDARARMPDFRDPVLLIEGKGSGPAQDMIRFVNESPILTRIDDFTRDVRIDGEAQLQLALQIPLRALQEVKVRGSVDFPGNRVRLDLPLPEFEGVKGRFAFDERTIAIDALRAQLLGEELLVSARTPAPGEVMIEAQGLMSARNLQQLVRHPVTSALSGAARFRAQVHVKDHRPAVRVSSDLVGMASSLPEPFAKSAEAPMALEVSTQARRWSAGPTAAVASAYDADRVSVRLGKNLALDIDRERNPEAPAGEPLKIRRAALLIAPDAQVKGARADSLPQAPLPPRSRGFAVEIRDRMIDFDAWLALLAADGPGGGAEGAQHRGLRERLAGDFVWRPQEVRLGSDVLKVGGRLLHEVLLAAQSTAPGGVPQWQIELRSREAQGQLLWQQAPDTGEAPARLQARFSRVDIPRERIAEVESLVVEPLRQQRLPEMQIEIGELRFGNASLGSAQLSAGPEGRDGQAWRIRQLTLSQEAASIQAQGLSLAGKGTQIHVTLKVQDGGLLLSRLGYPGLVRGGEGALEADLRWDGSPLSPDASSMDGTVHLSLLRGEFLKVEPGLASGLGKLLGVFNLQFLPRRLSLDFSDVFSEGFVFDSVDGSARLLKGLAHTDDLLMKGPSATVRMKGDINFKSERQSLMVRIEPELNAGLASLAYAAAVNPVVGLGSLIGQWVLKKPLQKLFEIDLMIAGTWADPEVRRLPRAETGPGAQLPLPATR